MRKMPLPEPFTLPGLIKNIEKAREREIRLVQLEDHIPGDTGPCGLWVRHSTRPVDLVLYVSGTSKFHRNKIIFHELSHIWLEDSSGMERDRFEVLFPGMPRQMRERIFSMGTVMTRSSYETYEEMRAEMLADHLHIASRRQGAIRDDATLNRLQESLSGPLYRGSQRNQDWFV
ncbi:hypothetical protein ABR737_00745 [Streptomyces sp. Edi2]|uniref:hypothetical protein n=1 Tax=Streptomyces sp. Edi2 TaxID=3162528 RepID=UPI00330569AC